MIWEMANEYPSRACSTGVSIDISCLDQSLQTKCNTLRAEISDLQKRVGDVEQTRVAYQTSAVLRQIALNIEHEVKKMIVHDVGPQHFPDIYPARTKSINHHVLTKTMVSALLNRAFDMLGESDYKAMETIIFPSGVELFEDTMYRLKRFSDSAHPTTFQNAPVDLKTAQELIEQMSSRSNDATPSSLEHCKTEGKLWLNTLVSRRSSPNDLLQPI